MAFDFEAIAKGKLVFDWKTDLKSGEARGRGNQLNVELIEALRQIERGEGHYGRSSHRGPGERHGFRLPP